MWRKGGDAPARGPLLFDKTGFIKTILDKTRRAAELAVPGFCSAVAKFSLDRKRLTPNVNQSRKRLVSSSLAQHISAI